MLSFMNHLSLMIISFFLFVKIISFLLVYFQNYACDGISTVIGQNR